MTTTTLYALYRSPLNVWVEDAVTHHVLTELWGDPQIHVLVADGKPGVIHMVNAAHKPLRSKVFGVVDRDFEDDNEANWALTSCRVLRLTTHELENLLLDFEILSLLSRSQSADEIQKMAREHAENFIVGWSVRRVCGNFKTTLAVGFRWTRPTP